MSVSASKGTGVFLGARGTARAIHVEDTRVSTSTSTSTVVVVVVGVADETVGVPSRVGIAGAVVGAVVDNNTISGIPATFADPLALASDKTAFSDGMVTGTQTMSAVLKGRGGDREGDHEGDKREKRLH